MFLPNMGAKKAIVVGCKVGGGFKGGHLFPLDCMPLKGLFDMPFPDCPHLSPHNKKGFLNVHAPMIFPQILAYLLHRTASLVKQALFSSSWLGPHASTMSRDVPDIHGDRADFCQWRQRGISFFKGLFSKEKRTFGFLGALSLSKSPKCLKDLFRENEALK